MPFFRVMRCGEVVGILAGLLLPTTINQFDSGVEATSYSMVGFFNDDDPSSSPEVLCFLSSAFLSLLPKYFFPVMHAASCFGHTRYLLHISLWVTPPLKFLNNL